MKKIRINFYRLFSFLPLLILLFSLTNLEVKSEPSNQTLPPIPGVGPTVCVSNCGGNENPTVSDSEGGLGEFCRVESDCDSGLRCVPTRACAAGCVACNGSTVTTCQKSTSSCGFKNRRCSIAQGRFCCRGFTCVGLRCRRACL